MSTIVSAKYRGDPARFEKLVESKALDFTVVAQARMAKGCISHRYAVSDDEIYVIDEWPSREDYDTNWRTHQGWSHEIAIEAGLDDPPEVIYLRTVADPGAFYHYTE